MLSGVQNLLGDLVRSDWSSTWDDYGATVDLYRQYERGDHPEKMTTAMRQMLRVSDSHIDQFNMNYCELVVQAMNDRLQVMSVHCGDEDVKAWGEEVLSANRFDGLQIDVHEAAIRDGDSFVMVWWDEDSQMVTLSMEEAWDGETGVIPIYDKSFSRLVGAVKVWYEVADERYCNVYLPDRVIRLTYDDGSVARRDEDVPMWGFVPMVHFRNKSKRRRETGRSELANVVPLQRALNRTLVSMVMTAELTAFGIRKAKGFAPPENLAPGSWVVIGEDETEAALINAMDADMMKQGELVPFLDQAGFLIDKIGDISRTPLAAYGANESGEARKERQTGLLGKVQRFQVKGGNAWEDVMTMAQMVYNLFSGRVLPDVTWRTVWRDAQLRNDAEIAGLITAFADRLSEREVLRLMGQIATFGYDMDDVDRIIEERTFEAQRGVEVALGNLPSFNGFNPSP